MYVSGMLEKMVRFDVNQIGRVFPHILSIVDDTNHVFTTRKQCSKGKKNVNKKLQLNYKWFKNKIIYFKFAVFELGSKHSSRERIRCEKNFPSGSKNRAIICAYRREPNVQICNSYFSLMPCRKLWVPGLNRVWYHGDRDPYSWKWYTSYTKKKLGIEKFNILHFYRLVTSYFHVKIKTFSLVQLK